MAIGSNSQINVGALPQEKRDQLKKAVKTIDDSLTRIIAERTLIKETIDNVATGTGLDKKLVRKLAKTIHKASYKMDAEENETFDELYHTLYGGA